MEARERFGDRFTSFTDFNQNGLCASASLKTPRFVEDLTNKGGDHKRIHTWMTQLKNISSIDKHKKFWYTMNQGRSTSYGMLVIEKCEKDKRWLHQA